MAAIGLAFLALGLTGIWTVVSAGNEISEIRNECGANACLHMGTLVSAQRTYEPVTARSLWEVGSQIDYCVLTLEIESSRRLVAVNGRTCPNLTVPSPVDAAIWRGAIISVKTPIGSFDTFRHPSFAVFDGLVRMLALIPFALCIAIIELDVLRHRPVWKVHNRIFKRAR